MSARKAHNTGRNHVVNVRDYFASMGNDTAQSIIDQIVQSHENGGRAQMFAAPSMRIGAGFMNPMATARELSSLLSASRTLADSQHTHQWAAEDIHHQIRTSTWGWADHDLSSDRLSLPMAVEQDTRANNPLSHPTVVHHPNSSLPHSMVDKCHLSHLLVKCNHHLLNSNMAQLLRQHKVCRRDSRTRQLHHRATRGFTLTG